MFRTVSMTVEFDVDIRGEFTEKKFLRLMRSENARMKNKTFTEIAIDGVPHENLRQLVLKELKEDLED